jgi:hypothetical protein
MARTNQKQATNKNSNSNTQNSNTMAQTNSKSNQAQTEAQSTPQTASTPANTQAQAPDPQKASPISGLNEEQFANLLARVDNTIYYEDGAIKDSATGVELNVYVENGSVKVQNAFSDSFSVQVEKLNSDVIKPRKRKVLADKIRNVITSATQRQQQAQQIEQDLEAIRSKVQPKFKSQLGEIVASDVSAEEFAHYRVQFNSGAVLIKKQENSFKVVQTIDMNEVDL